MLETAARLKKYLSDCGRLYPTAWKQYDVFRADRGVDLDHWPAWCYCPLAGAYAIISGGGDNRLGVDRIVEVSRLGALAAWRVTQGIYRFDPDLFQSLWETVIEDTIPIDVFYYLPEWSIYIETPSMKDMQGFFVYLEFDPNDSRAELRFLLDHEAGLVPYVLHLSSNNLMECIEAVVREAKKQGSQELATISEISGFIIERIKPLVSLTLYLCSLNAEVRDQAGTDKEPGRPRPVRTKKGDRLFPPAKVITWEVGYRIGAALRAARQEQPAIVQGGSHASPRAHIRRAHWHSYWTGPRKGSRRVLLKWLNPVLVGKGVIVPTVHDVKLKI